MVSTFGYVPKFEITIAAVDLHLSQHPTFFVQQNFRTDLYDPQWSYMAALDKGWIPRGSLLTNSEIADACKREDSNDYICMLKKDQLESSIRSAVKFIFDKEGVSNDTAKEVLGLEGVGFRDKANQIVTDYFRKYYSTGATCDFGGIAMLVERNRNESDEGGKVYTYYDDEDEYYGYNGGRYRINLWVLIAIGFGVAFFGGLIGFVFAMRCSPGFNERVRKSPALKPLTGSEIDLVRASLYLPKRSNYEEIEAHGQDRLKEENDIQP